MAMKQWTVALVALCAAQWVSAELAWQSALTGEHRAAENRARDVHRHPQETLAFGPGGYDGHGGLARGRLVHQSVGAAAERQWHLDRGARQRMAVAMRGDLLAVS